MLLLEKTRQMSNSHSLVELTIHESAALLVYNRDFNWYLPTHHLFTLLFLLCHHFSDQILQKHQFDVVPQESPAEVANFDSL